MSAHRHRDQAQGQMGQGLKVMQGLLVKEFKARLSHHNAGQDLTRHRRKADASSDRSA